MTKEDAIDKLEEALDLVVEAQYIIEGILPHINSLYTIFIITHFALHASRKFLTVCNI